MKRFFAILCVASLLMLSTVAFSSCTPKGEDTVELTSENYSEYLQIKTVVEGDGLGSGCYFDPTFKIEVTPIDENCRFEKTKITISGRYYASSHSVSSSYYPYYYYYPSYGVSSSDYDDYEVTISINSKGEGSAEIASRRSDYSYYMCGFSDFTVDEISGSAIVLCLHEWDDGKTIAPASCTAEGTKMLTCTKCEMTKEDKIEPVDHEFITEPKGGSPATCTEEGTEIRFCERCGEDVTIKIPALGHDYPEENITMVEATCTQNAEKKSKCSRCYQTETFVIENSALGHKYGEDGRCTACGAYQ